MSFQEFIVGGFVILGSGETLVKVGFIGLGAMGSAIASNILTSGHELTVYNRTIEKTKTLISAGARLAKTPAEAAQGDIVLSMVIDDHALEQILFAEGRRWRWAAKRAGQGYCSFVYEHNQRSTDAANGEGVCHVHDAEVI